VGLAERFAAQLAWPRGGAGRWLGRVMDIANAGVVRQAVDLLAPRDGEVILDAGCGTGAALAEVGRRARCAAFGVDRSEAMIAAAARRLGDAAKLEVGSLEAPWPATARADGVLLLNVLYFCGADATMVRALHTRLRPGGRLVAYVTDRQTMERWPFAHSGIHRLFDAPGLVQVLVEGGFAPARVTVHELPVAGSARGLFAVARREAANVGGP
jgi:SAM-dependent methyltransferase